MRALLASLMLIGPWLHAVAEKPGSAYPIVVSEEKRPLTPAEVERAVEAWLGCYECTQGEFRRVLRAGEAAVAQLERALEADEPDVRERQKAALAAEYERLQIHARKTGRDVEITGVDYVTLKLDAFIKLRSARARRALAALGAEPAPVRVEP